MWDCTGAVQLTYDLGSTAIAHDATTPAQQPFARTMWRGTCDAGQLTPGGLRDAARHGKVCRASALQFRVLFAEHALYLGPVGTLP